MEFFILVKINKDKRGQNGKIKYCHYLNCYKSLNGINPGVWTVLQGGKVWLQIHNFGLEIHFDGVIMKRAVNTNYIHMTLTLSFPLSHILSIFNHLQLHLTRRKSWALILTPSRVLSSSEMAQHYFAMKDEHL